MQDENGDLLADSHNILNRRKNCFSQLLNVHGVSDVRLIEVHTSELTIPDRSLSDLQSPGSGQIPVDMIQAGGEILLSAIHIFFNSIWNKEELLDQWKESVSVAIHKKGDKTDCNNYRGISSLSMIYKSLSIILLSWLNC
jgi:hypothetical protein